MYRIVQDHLETFLVQDRDNFLPRSATSAEDSMRAFLECGIHRFGVARFLCRRCGHDVFVAFSCKRRLACPSCDGKRAVVESSRATEELLPCVPYRQWVLVLPKRLRYFVHRDPSLAGGLSRILARALTRFYQTRAAGGSAAATAQWHGVQRFGSKVNLHVHVHAVVSDGVFLLEDGVLRFYPAPEPTAEELADLSRELRRRILRRMLKLNAIPEDAAREMLARPHGGFSLDAQVRVEAEDRAALDRLLRYMLRPAVSIKRLSYRPEQDQVRYWPKKGRPGEPEVLEWEPVEFLGRFARLIPPARLHLVRYHGALGPASRLRAGVTQAAREGLSYQALLAGAHVCGALGAAAAVGRVVHEAVSAAARYWAACLRKVFEVDALLCPRCGTRMVAVAAIEDDRELDRLLAHLGLHTDFPKAKPARSPPRDWGGKDSQVDPVVEAWEGRDVPPAQE